MEAENKKPINDNEIQVWKKSWLAYLFIIIPAVITFIISTLISSFSVEALNVKETLSSDIRGAIVLILSGSITLAVITLYILSIKSYQLYYDNDGIWVYSGILPWTKGVSGIKWRDLDEAVYFTGFISWATHSYRVRLTHRFTKSSEIVLTHIKDGDKAVQDINQRHREYLNKSKQD